MANKPELSIKVSVDPVINRTKFQEDINKLIPESNPVKINGEFDAAKMLDGISDYQKGGKNAVTIHGKIDAAEALKSIAKYQEGGQNQAVILGKFSNVKEMLNDFKNETAEINASLTQDSLSNIRDQLQGMIDNLDYSKLEGASASTSTGSTKRTKKGKKTTVVDTSTASKQEIPVDIAGTISDDSVTALKTKIEAGLNDVAIVANIAPDQLSKIRKDVEAAFNGIAITPIVKGVNGAAAQTGTKKKINIPSDDKIMEQMANAQYTATKNENAEAAAVKQKNIIYQNLADHQAKVSENASAATAKTAQGLSDANKAMGDLNASAVDFEQDWRQVVTLIASATKNLANLMNSYKEFSGLDVFSSFQEFQEELPDLDTEHVKPYLKSIKDWSDSLLGSANGDFDSNTMIQAIHMLSGLADAWNNIDVSKLTDNKTKDKLLKEMSELNSIFPSSGDKQPFLGEKDAAINYLTDLLAKAAKYYAEVGNAAKQTADSIAVANEGFANQTTKLKKNNAELEKLKQNGTTFVKENTIDTPSISEKITLKSEDITPPETPVEIPGHVTLTEADITVPDKVDLNGNLVIKNATKEIKAATKEAEAEVSKESKKASKRDTEKEKQRKKKEYLLALGSLLKKNANTQNELSDMYPDAPDYKELQNYIGKLHRRTGTTVNLLDTLVGRDGWKNDVLYTSAVEDSMHIRSRKKAGDKTSETIKAGIAEEKEYVSILKQIPDLEEAAAKALADFGDQSVHYQDANKKLTNAKDTIRAFEQKYGEAYSDLLRSEVIEQQNLSKAMAQEKAIRDAQLAQEEEANKKRIADEQRYLKELAQEPKLRQDTIDKQRKYGDNDYRTQRAVEDYDKNHSSVTAFENSLRAQKRSPSNIPGYADVVEANKRSWEDWHQKVQDTSAAQRAKDAKLAADDERKNITEYKSLLKEKYDYQRKISEANNDTDTKVWEDIVVKDSAKLTALKKNLQQNQDVIDELDLIEQSYITSEEDRDNNALGKAVSKQQSDYVKDAVFGYKTLISFQNKRSSLFKPEDIDRLNDIDEAIQRVTVSMRGIYDQARKSGFDINSVSGVNEQMNNLAAATKISKREFKNNQDANNLKINTKLLEQYNQELTRQFRLYKELKQADPNNAPELAAKRMAFDNQKTLVNSLRKEIHQKKLNTTFDYKQLTNQYNANVAGLDSVVDSKVVNAENSRLDKQIASYRTLLKEKYDLMSKIFNAEDNTDTTEWVNRINEIKAEIDAGKQKLIGAGRQSDVDDLNKFDARLKAGYDNAVNKDANTKAEKEKAEFIAKIVDSYKQLEALQNQRVTFTKDGEEDELNRVDKKIKDITDDLKAMYQQSIKMGYKLSGNQDILNASAKASSAKRLANNRINKFGEKENQQLFDDYNNQIKRYKSNADSYIREKGNGDNPHLTMSYWEEMNKASKELSELDSEISSRGLWLSQQHLEMARKRALAEDAVTQALKNQVKAEQENNKAKDKDLVSVQNLIDKLDGLRGTLEKDNKTDSASYADVLNIRSLSSDLMSRLIADPTNKDRVAIDWAKSFGITGINSFEEALDRLKVSASETGNEVKNLRIEAEKFRSDTKGKTEVANLKSQLIDYLEKFPKVEKTLAEPVQKLKAALADPDAYKNVGQLKQDMAELRAQAKSLGLESENLIDKFEKLFGQHLSTMITMAALHKMQDALQIVYQNVVEIDTAVTELRKVSEYAGKSLEEYMGRAAEQAQKLGVSISDYVNSTADWKRLGYSDEDAENLATYSTLLKNVGDNIDDVNTSSSYLISTLQGFGLLADQAEDVVNKIDAVANTQPVTANDLGEILTRSSAAMSAANNTLEETIALGTAANAVIQDADTVGKVYADAA